MLAWPTPVDASAAGPLTAVTRWLASHGLGWMNYSFMEFCANVALFVPIGFLVVLIAPQLKSWHVVIGVACASSLAEIGQTAFRPERFGTLQDVLANTAGAALGIVVARIVRGRKTAAP